MKVLHFFDGRRRETSILQIDFILMLQKYCDLYVYGPHEQELNGEKISPIKFNKDLKLEDVAKEINPDIIILPEHVVSKVMTAKLGYFSNITNIPKVSMEVDYYTVLEDKDWIKDNDINFIVSRGPYPDEAYPVPHVWLPWSAHDMFYTDETTDYFKDRLEKIIFIGGGRYSRNKYYLIRQKAIRLLEKEDMLDFFETAPTNIYMDFMQKYMCGLCCSFKGLNMAPAKTFEIIALGTALLTTDFIHKDILFGNKQCFFEYKEDCSDLLEVSEKILDDIDMVKEITKNGLEVVNKKHLHRHRIIELYNILEALVNGTTIPKVWGI